MEPHLWIAVQQRNFALYAYDLWAGMAYCTIEAAGRDKKPQEAITHLVKAVVDHQSYGADFPARPRGWLGSADQRKEAQ